MLRVVVVAVRIREVVWVKKENDNFMSEIVKYRFAGKLII